VRILSVLCWSIQFITALILTPMILVKLAPAPEAVEMFERLQMEPQGRYLIAALELLAVVLLLIRASAPWGAILGWGVMTGAVIAHCTVLGLGKPVPPLGVPLGALAIVNWIGFTLLIVLRGKQVPFIRSMYPSEVETRF